MAAQPTPHAEALASAYSPIYLFQLLSSTILLLVEVQLIFLDYQSSFASTICIHT